MTSAIDNTANETASRRYVSNAALGAVAITAVQARRPQRRQRPSQSECCGGRCKFNGRKTEGGSMDNSWQKKWDGRWDQFKGKVKQTLGSDDRRRLRRRRGQV